MKLFIIALISIGGCIAYNIKYEPIDGSTIESLEYKVEDLASEPRDRTARVVGGQEARPHQFPWIVAVHNQVWGRPTLCVGNIITYRAVLGTIGCTGNNVAPPIIIAGAHNRLIVEPSQQRFRAPFSNVHQTSNIIILILKTGERFTFNSNVQPARLPTQFATETFAGETGTFAGWGRTNPTGPASDKLQFATAPIVSVQECRSLFPVNIAEASICTSTRQGTSKCDFDGGAPLVVQRPGSNIPVLVGLGLHYGRPCKLRGNAFVRVTNYLTWISQNSDPRP